MPNTGLTGSRIRQTRLSNGVAQAELASNVGISPSYLNLIEHNRRRIGGKLLVDIASQLNVEATLLSEGAQSMLLDALAKASSDQPGIECEDDKAVEMAGRFPGWAGLVAAQHSKVENLTQQVEALTDRLAHDPQLAALMHEMLTVVTAIRSTATILQDSGELDQEWRARFNRNINEDSKRLAQNAQSLAAYFDASIADGGGGHPELPSVQFNAWLSEQSFHIAMLEGPDAIPVSDAVATEPGLISDPVIAAIATSYFERYRQDALALPSQVVAAAVKGTDFDPLTFCREIGVEFSIVLRRIASLPKAAGVQSGLVSCDSSGAMLISKPVDGFALPRYGAACPLWPIFQALSRPATPLCSTVQQAGYRQPVFKSYAVAVPKSAEQFNVAPLLEATMLILPSHSETSELTVGPTCRICQRGVCPGRREPSILAPGF